MVSLQPLSRLQAAKSRLKCQVHHPPSYRQVGVLAFQRSQIIPPLMAYLCTMVSLITSTTNGVMQTEIDCTGKMIFMTDRVGLFGLRGRLQSMSMLILTGLIHHHYPRKCGLFMT